MKKKTALEKILKDTTSGSTDLLLKLNDIVKANLDNKSDLKLLLKTAKQKFKSFEVIQNYLGQIESYNKKTSNKSLKEFVDGFTHSQDQSFEAIYENALPYLRKANTILTLSNSKTISETLVLLGKRNTKLRITIAESRPKLEGRILARNLLKNKIRVEFITDAMLPQFISKADAVIIGADKILSNGNIINKAGSLSAAILCHYYSKPFYVLASKDKLSKRERHIHEEYKPAEVWSYNSSYLKVANIYFEEVNNKLITKIITN